ncbi:hypothetical protein OG767_26035 [Micromonospora sp. NBC_01392]|uniref:hypothetical protein n=1 Tax=Micromonospora sp. NBC_01392 TaxID=2903588 RepID=UPI00324B2574
MSFDAARDEWLSHGFVTLPGYLPAADLAPALGELDTMFPSADGFQDGTDPRRDRYLGDEFAGIRGFPFESLELSLLAVGDRLVRLARELLGEEICGSPRPRRGRSSPERPTTTRSCTATT